ncbi:MAG: cobalt transporter CbiM [Methanocellales archaeon]
MHIPDGFIPLEQCAIYFLITAPFIALSIKWARKEMDDKKVPLLATLAAGIFAIQAINIPIPWGTSGHMVGAVLAAIVFSSPWAGVLLLTIVLLVQGFVFADGGITALGANILNMGIICTFVGYYLYLAMRKLNIALPIAAFTGAWLGLFTSAIACSLELYLAGTFPLYEGLLFMGMYHAVIGLVAEGIITAIVVKAIATIKPELIEKRMEAAV